MSNNKILDELIAAKVSSETILAVAKLIADAELTRESREKARTRMRAVRERSRMSLNTHEHSRTQSGIYTSTSIEVDKKESKKVDARKRKTRLPEGFSLSAASSLFAERKGWGSARIQSEFNRFCDHARANGRTQIDWEAAWRNWVTSPFQKPETANGQHKKSISDVLIEMCEASSRAESENPDWVLPKNGSSGPGDLWEGLSGRSYGVSGDDSDLGD